jgi:hypothetical protein
MSMEVGPYDLLRLFSCFGASNTVDWGWQQWRQSISILKGDRRRLGLRITVLFYCSGDIISISDEILDNPLILFTIPLFESLNFFTMRLQMNIGNVIMAIPIQFNRNRSGDSNLTT